MGLRQKHSRCLVIMPTRLAAAWQRMGACLQLLGKLDNNAGRWLVSLAAGRQVIGKPDTVAGRCLVSLASCSQVIGNHGKLAGRCSVFQTILQAGEWRTGHTETAMLLVSLPNAAVRCLGSIGKLVCSLRCTDSSPIHQQRTYWG